MIGIVRGWRVGPIVVFLLIGVLLPFFFDFEQCRCQTTFSLTYYSSATRTKADPWADESFGYLAKGKKGGIDFFLSYTGEAFHGFDVVPAGATEYRGLLELEASLDTGKAGLWPGGALFIKGQNGHGEGFMVNPGGVSLPLSDIGAPDFTQLSEYGLKQNLVDGSARMILGKQNANDYFSVNRFGGSVIFPAYTLIATVPMPTYPAYALGTSLFLEPAKWLSLGMGVYNGAPEIGSLGFEAVFKKNAGVFSILEFTWKPYLDARDEPNGHYSLGIWYQSGDFVNTRIATGTGTFSDNYGWYLMLDRLLFREPGTESADQGLGAFFQFGWAPEDRNSVTQYLGAGFTYKGLFPGRDEDELGIGLSYTWLIAAEPVAGTRTHLTLLECFYKVRFNSWMSLQPDVQYCDNPGVGRKNGFAAGIRSMINY
jgi:porin